MVYELSRPRGLARFNVEVVLSALRWTIFNPAVLLALPFVVVFGAGQPVSSPAGKAVLAYCCTIIFIRLVARLTRVALTPSWWLVSPPKVDWADQVVVVTGGASGLGAVLVERLAQKGARVAALDIRQASFTSKRISCFQCDVSSPSAVSSTARLVRAQLGPVTMLVNNAGVAQARLLVDLTEAEITQSVSVNLLGPLWTTRAFLPDMLDRRAGHIMNVSSVMGIVGCARMVDYCSTKAAVLAFHESLQFELRSQYAGRGRHIFTTVVCPSLISGPMFDRAGLAESWLFRFVSPRLGQEDVVEAMVRALGECESKTLMLPSYVRLTPLVRWLPGVRQLAQWILNVDHSFDSFHDDDSARPSPSPGDASSVSAGKTEK